MRSRYCIEIDKFIFDALEIAVRDDQYIYMKIYEVGEKKLFIQSFLILVNLFILINSSERLTVVKYSKTAIQIRQL